MFSRRHFLLGSVASLACFGEFLPDGFARAAKKGAVAVKGAHILARQIWPPAISADFVGTCDGGFCVIADQFGRLAIVDLQKAGADGSAAHVLAELSGLGKRVLDLNVYAKRAVVLVSKPAADASEQQFALVVINLSPITAPSVVASLTLEKFSEATSLTASQDLACVCGLSSAGENMIATYMIGRGKAASISQVGVMALDSTFDDIDLQDKVLLGVHGGESPKLSVISLANPSVPQVRASLTLNGKYSLVGRFRDVALLAGQSEVNNSVHMSLLSLRQKPEIVGQAELTGARAVSDVVGQKDAFLILGENAEGRALFSVAVSKSEISQQNFVSLGGEKGPGESAPRLAANPKLAFVGTGWNGLQAIKYGKGGLSVGTTYKIPRLPASGLAVWANSIVLASADLKLYDISEAAKPSLKKATVLPTAVKAVTGAGSFILCLSKEEVQLRKFDDMDAVIASYKVSGRALCFDSAQQIAYVIRDEKKKAIAQQLKAYSNALVAADSFEIGANYARAFAYGGYLLVGTVNDLSLYSVNGKLELIGSRHFDNFAIRDFTMGETYIFATAVDQKSLGFFLVLSKDKGELKLVGSIDLPHDGVAIAGSKDIVATVGRSSDGKDLLSIINVSYPGAPKITTSLPALESASSIALKDNLAIVGGRGLEIVSLT
jgi:hypothetical protein